MKIAIGLKGIHYWENFVTNDGRKYNIDFNNYVNGFMHYIVNNLKQNNHKVDIYISTYNTEKQVSMLETYNPVDCIMVQNNDSTKTAQSRSFPSQNKHYANIISMIQKNSTKYDLIILTRFDIYIFKLVYDMNIDYNKINFVFQHANGNCDDNFIVFPTNMINTFLEAIKHTDTCCHMMSKFIPKRNTHYIENFYNGKIIDNQLFSIYKTPVEESELIKRFREMGVDNPDIILFKHYYPKLVNG
jgi:hypothetical protein